MTGPAVVVGGSNGIGAAVVADLRTQGTEVLTWDVDGDADIVVDITDPDAIDAAAAQTVGAIGTPATVTITAGIGHGAMLLDAGVDDWDRVMNTNARGVWLTMRALARPMLEGEGGSIVAVSSISARLADRSMGLYCASKAALDMVIAVCATEWAPKVRVNGVAPGVTDTRMLGGAPLDRGWLKGVGRRTPLGRVGTPEDIAEAVAAMHASRWTTGEVLTCDGGLARFSPIMPIGDYRQD